MAGRMSGWVLLALVLGAVALAHLVFALVERHRGRDVRVFEVVMSAVVMEAIALGAAIASLAVLGRPLEQEVANLFFSEEAQQRRATRRDYMRDVEACIADLSATYTCETFLDMARRGEWPRWEPFETAEKLALQGAQARLLSVSETSKHDTREPRCDIYREEIRLGCEARPREVR